MCGAIISSHEPYKWSRSLDQDGCHVKVFLKLLQHKMYDDHGASETRGHKICIYK